MLPLFSIFFIIKLKYKLCMQFLAKYKDKGCIRIRYIKIKTIFYQIS
jgi:hypothetical protein